MTPREAPPDLQNLRVLVVEDEALVAMMIEDFLSDAGCVVVGPAATVAEAMDLLRHNSIDAATLDVNLGTEEVRPVAEILEAAGTPFILVSGYDRENVFQLYRRWPLLQKPFTRESLTRTLTRVLAG